MSEATAERRKRRTPKTWATGRILSAADYAELIATEQDRRSDTAGGIRQLPTLHDEARLHGYQQGVRSALLDLNATLLELRRCRSERNAWLQAYVFAILRKVLGNSDPSSLVPAIAQQAMEQCEQGLEVLTVHVHPEAAPAVTKRFGTTSQSAIPNGLQVDIVADDRLSRTACEIHTPFGIVDASLEIQLDALELALGGGDAAARHGKQ